MGKTAIIFKHEFLQAVKRIGYLVMMFLVPLSALVAIGAFRLVLSWVEPGPKEAIRVGYVDEVGIFNEQTDQGMLSLIPFDSQEDATQALVVGQIQEYLVIPANYTAAGVVMRYTMEKELVTPQSTTYSIDRFLTWNQLKERVPPEVIGSVIAPLQLVVTRLDSDGNVAQEQGNAGNVIIPAVFALLLSLALMFGTNSLISGLGEEKESRLIEVLFSSASIRQLLVAKVLALGAAGLLQVLVWLISAPLLLRLASSTFGGFLSDIQIPPNFILLGVLYFILGYLLFAVLSVSVGAITSNATEAHSLSMFYGLAQFIPLWFAGFLINFPKSTFWIVLTIFPITAPITVMLRLGVTDVPTWELLTSLGVMLLSVFLGIYLAIRTVRVFMLMYGKRPSLGEIARALRQG